MQILFLNLGFPASDLQIVETCGSKGVRCHYLLTHSLHSVLPFCLFYISPIRRHSLLKWLTDVYMHPNKDEHHSISPAWFSQLCVSYDNFHFIGSN